MSPLIAAMLMAAAGQVSGGLNAGDRYPDPAQAAPAQASPGEQLGAQGGLAGQIRVSGDSPSPTLPGEPSAAAPPRQSAPDPANAPLSRGPQSPNASAAAPPSVPKTSALIRDWSKAPLTGQLAGVPMSLSEALRDAKTRQQQTDRTMGYWDLAAKVTQYYLVRRDALELAALRQGVATPSTQWQAKALDLQTEQELAQQSAIAAQARFQQLLGRTAAQSPPLPVDLPHCGRYETRYEEIFAERTEPAARQLNDLLPLKYAELRNQSKLVAAAYSWLQQVSQTRDPNSDGVELLRAHELVSLRRRALVEWVRDYNQDIAAYTELAAPSDVGSERLVAMLIRVSNPAGVERGASGVQQASATESGGAKQASAEQDSIARGSSQQAGGYRSRTVRRPAFWRLRNREHSILVDRLRLRQRSSSN